MAKQTTTNQKSAIIWNEIETLRYAIVDGDWRKFQGIYINAGDSDKKLTKALISSVYGEEGAYLLTFCTLNEFEEAIRDGAHAVECGFVP